MRTLMPGKRMADLAALGADLTETRGAEIVRVDRHGGRAFGAAVAFERADAELLLEGLRHAVGKFLRAGHDELAGCRNPPARNRACTSAETSASPAGTSHGTRLTSAPMAFASSGLT